MALSEGQRTALDQLRRIAAVDRSPLRILDVEAGASGLVVHVTLDCSRYERVEGGLPLNAREGVALIIPADFPYSHPIVRTPHARFRRFRHVQWGRQLCLYASETQWNPSQGMFGFMAQLDAWLRRGARNELDHPDQPLHPPVDYLGASTSIRINADTPDSSHWPWFGAALLERSKPDLLVVNSWRLLGQVPEGFSLAPTVLVDFELPFEYPLTVQHLLACLNEKGVESSQVLVHLMRASERVPEDEPLHVGIGAPSRGQAGNLTGRRQHLTFWEIEPSDVTKLREAALAFRISNYYKGEETPERIRSLLDSTWKSLMSWRNEAGVRWCSVIENRPEVIIRRDESTPMDWFRGKRVALWGCGAIGGLIAEHLARAGVAELRLHDRGVVTPGILVRQNYTEADINEPKARALARRIRSIAPDTVVTPMVEDIVSRTLSGGEWDADVDVVIDATASLPIRSKLEARLKHHQRRGPIAAVMISGSAKQAITAVSPSRYRGGPLDVFRRLGLAAFKRGWLKEWVQAFWVADAAKDLRQPEPGCSDPTFIGSYADVATLSARALNVIAAALAEERDTATGVLLAQAPELREHRFRFRPDTHWVEGGLDFRLSSNAWRDMNGWIRAGARERSPQDETGGLLFGQFDETLGIAWISNVSGPPRDSRFSDQFFVCGTHGIGDLCKHYADCTNKMVRYIGTWHSHPASPAEPSARDYQSIRELLAKTPADSAHQLMMIVGCAANERKDIGAYAFERRDIPKDRGRTHSVIGPRGGVTTAPTVAPLGSSIGLALSGGGSRAVAFHLGTLRALEDLELLDEVDVVSGVSGGSIMTGLLGYTDAPFSDIDRNAVEFLGKGLVWRTLRKFTHPACVLPLLWNLTFVALPTLAVDVAVGFVRSVSLPFPALRRLANAASRCHWPLRHRYSRTHVFSDAIAALLGTHYCDAPTRQGKAIVFNACELRTGTAFRMSNERLAAWRRGRAPAGELRVADAVAASAAYPSLLPPFDWKRRFKRRGKTKEHRVIVTDGGVFDNLGVSVMEPGRDPRYSPITYNPNVIISSDAGVGQFVGKALPRSWPKRMTKVGAAVMRKVQDATKKRLHHHQEAGRIDGFVYAALGQFDQRVPLKSGRWVARDEVIDYPTDFSAMSRADMRKLSARGETITRALVTQYLLSD